MTLDNLVGFLLRKKTCIFLDTFFQEVASNKLYPPDKVKNRTNRANVGGRYKHEKEFGQHVGDVDRNALDRLRNVIFGE